MQAVRLPAMVDAARRRAAQLRPRRAALEQAALAAPPVVPFAERLAGPAVAVIAEVKRRSPSAGTIADLDAPRRAAAYVRGGAAAVSVLTDPEFFGGRLADLAAVATAVPVPVLRKDFIVEELQLLEARAAGASAVLLIARILGAHALEALTRAAAAVGLAALIEVHSEAELAGAVAAAPAAIGVNCRDLDTFMIHPERADRLLAAVPPAVIAVAESGLRQRADVERVAAAGADAVLVGTALSAAGDAVAAVAALGGVPRNPRSGGRV